MLRLTHFFLTVFLIGLSLSCEKTTEGEQAFTVAEFPSINSSNLGHYQLQGTCSSYDGKIMIRVNTDHVWETTCANYIWQQEINLQEVKVVGKIPIEVIEDGNAHIIRAVVVKNIEKLQVTIASANIHINTANQSSYTIEGECTSGLEVTIRPGTLPSLTRPCLNSAWKLENFDTIGLSEGKKYSLLITQTDVFNNTRQADRVFDKDVTPPIVTLNSDLRVNGKNKNKFNIKGSCGESGRDVTVNIASTTPVSITCNNGYWQHYVDLSDDITYPQGHLTVVTAHTDSVENLTKNTYRLKKDTTLPTITIDNLAPYNLAVQQGTYTLQGDCEGEYRVDIDIPAYSSTSMQVTCSDGRWQLILKDYWRIKGNRVSVTITSQDDHTNSKVISSEFLNDRMAPQLELTTKPLINLENSNGFVLSGTCSDEGRSVNLRLGNRSKWTYPCTGGHWSFAVAANLPEGKYPIGISHQDEAQNSITIDPLPVLIKDITLPDFAFVGNLGINATNQSNYVVGGTCQEDGTIVVSIPSLNNQRVICGTDKTWRTQEFGVTTLSNGVVTITATMVDLAGNANTITKEIIKTPCSTNAAERIFAFDSNPLSIDSANQNNFRISGTCDEDGGISLSVPYHDVMTINCQCGIWKSESLDGYNIPLGNINITATKKSSSKETHSVNAVVTNASTVYLPYSISPRRSYNDALPQGLPHNYLARIAMPDQDSPTELAINSISFEGLPGGPYTKDQMIKIKSTWLSFFNLETNQSDNMGILSVIDDGRILGSFINSSKYADRWRLASFWTSGRMGRADLPKPKKFILNIGLQNDQSFSLNVVVAPPAFGNENCNIMNWNEDLGSWTTIEVAELRRKACMELDYGYTPRGIKFTTTDKDIDALPSGLSQAKENYKIIFKDDFSETGGLEKLDHRLWFMLKGRPCHSFRMANGELTLDMSTTCLSAAGKIANVELIPKLFFKYGYFELRLSRIPHARNGDMKRPYGPIFYWNAVPSLGRDISGIKVGVNKSLWNFICRGNNSVKKRKRWFSTVGGEFQFVESIYWSTDNMAYPSGWWVFHTSLDSGWVQNCHTGRPMYSGILLKNWSFRAHEVLQLGMEWTPSGWRTYLNGRPYEGVSRSDGKKYYGEYGHSSPNRTNVYGYENILFPSSGLVERHVSHIYQDFSIGLSHGTSNNGDPSGYPAGWKDDIKIDYFRVYQPIDKYQSETKNYR